MWFWLVAHAKESAGEQEISAKRRQWVSEGKDAKLLRLCRSAQRYVVAERTPPTVCWLIEGDDPAAVELITGHFGSLWDIDTQVVVPQPIGEAVGSMGPKKSAPPGVGSSR